MIYIIEMIDDLNEVEQDVLEEIDPDLVSYSFSTRGGDQLVKIVSIVRRLFDYCHYVKIFWYKLIIIFEA